MKYLKYLICISYLIVIVLCQEDYYKILGVSRQAKDAEIKRAFKKLALKYHPDKIKEEKDQEAAQKKFAEIANAYEVLKDPQRRAEYDERLRTGNFQGFNTGGSKNQQGGFGNFGNFNDFFQSFFFDFGGAGGAGGGGKKQQFNFGGPGGGGFNFGNFGGGAGGGDQGFNFGNFGGGQQQGGFNFGGQQGGGQRQQKPKSIFQGSKVIEINMNKLSSFFNRQEVWLILFYKPQTIGKMEKTWKELADKESEFYKVSAVNCQKEKEICSDEFKIQEGKNVIVLGFPRKGGLSTQKQYKGKSDINKFDTFAQELIDAKITNLDKSNYFDFIENNNEKNIALFFGKKGKISSIFKLISQDFEKTFVFGEIYDNEKELIQKFGVKKFPSLVIVTDGFLQQGQLYSGEIKREAIQKYFKSYLSNNNNQKLQNKITQIRELKPEIVKQGTICGPKDNKYCLILIVDNPNNSTIIDQVTQISQHYKKDPLRFYFVLTSKIQLNKAFNNELAKANGPIILMIKGKKNQYRIMGDTKYDTDSISQFIDNTLSGSSSLSKLTMPLSLAIN